MLKLCSSIEKLNVVKTGYHGVGNNALLTHKGSMDTKYEALTRLSETGQLG